jgi:hypothetical protein
MCGVTVVFWITGPPDQSEKGKRIMRTGAIGLAILGALLVAAPAVAQTDHIEILLDHVLRGDPGDVYVVHTEPVDPALVGGTCSATAQTENNASEHANNDLLIVSGADAMTIPNFEAVAGQVTATTGPLTLGESITVSIRLGGDGISSEDLRIVLSCARQEPEPTTTTTAAPEPTTTVTSPPQPRTTVTTPPKTAPAPPADPETRAIQAVAEAPVGGVSAGGGSTVATSSPDRGVMALGAALFALALGLLAQHRARALRERVGSIAWWRVRSGAA